MKKKLAMLLVLAMSVSLLAACGSSSSDDTSDASADSASEESADTEESAEAEEATDDALESLRGATVVCKTGTTGSQYAEELAEDYEFELLYVEDSSTMYTYVESGQAAACFEDYPIVQYEIARGNISLEVINVSDYSYPTGLATMADTYPELVAAFNEGLYRLQADGTYGEILATYFGDTGEDYTPEEDSSGEDESVYGEAEGKTYVVGTDTTFAPFEFEDDNGDFTGIDILLLEAIAEEMGFTVDWQILGFSASVTALEANQVDAVMAGMSITEERMEKYDFSDSYYDCAIAVAVPAE